MKQFAWLVIALSAGLTALAQVSDTGREKMPWQSKETAENRQDAGAVQFLSPAQVSVSAGKLATVELHFRVADGLHINSHVPHDANLVPTQLASVDGGGLKTERIDFPAGTDAMLPFAPKEKLNIYSGEFVLKAQVLATAGRHEWQGLLRYQACNLNECMPPRKLAVTVDLVAK